MGNRVKYAESLPRDLSHPFTHVVFEVDNHTHMYTAGGGELIEELAAGLAESVLECGQGRNHIDRHGIPHGVVHGPDAAEAAFKSACEQLICRDYYDEYLNLQRKIEHYELWGGHPPALVIQPKPGDHGTWQLEVTHPITGMPQFYDIPASLMDIPEPDPKLYHEGQMGYYYKGNVNRSRLPVRR